MNLPLAALDDLRASDRVRARGHRLTLRGMRAGGRDPFAIFRAEEALAIDPGWLARVVEGAPLAFWDDGEGEGEADDTLASAGERLPYELLGGGVARYDIEGPLTQRGWMCWQGYDSIGRDLSAALADERVTSVLLVMNSPGGACAGCFEGVRRMRADVEASGKRVVAFADEMAYSAGYAIACVADEIVLPEPGGVGSVGVIAGLQSYARMLEAAGVDTRVLTSGREKADGSPVLPIDEAAVARVQARVDELAGIFQRWVAARRGMTPAAVAALEAGVRYGGAAVSARLADRVASLPDVIASMKTPAPAKARGPNRPAAAGASRNPMDEKLSAAIAALTGTDDAGAQLAALGTISTERADAAKLSAAVAEATGKAGLDEQVGALGALAVKARGYDEAAKRAEAAERAAAASKLEALIARGRDEGKLTAAQCAPAEGEPGAEGYRPAGWARRQTAESLAAFLEDAPQVLPRGEHKAPAGAKGSVDLPQDVAALAAKARSEGWASLSADEKHAVRAHSAELADRLAGGRDDR